MQRLFLSCLQHLLNDPQLQALRKHVQHQQQWIPVDSVGKSRRFFPENDGGPVRNDFGRNIARFHPAYNILETLGVAGIQLSVLTECIERLHAAGVEASMCVWKEEGARPEVYMALWDIGFDHFTSDYPEFYAEFAKTIRK